METTLLPDARLVLMCGTLFASVVMMTAGEPAAVPPLFVRLWRRYRMFQETRKMKRSSKTPAGEKFWEIDMTNFEP